MAAGCGAHPNQYRRHEEHASGNGSEAGYEDEVPVLIIGGGPTGLLQAHLLSQLGVSNMVVERYAERLGAPKAHALSPRSLEVCRQFHLDVRQLRSMGTARNDARWVNFITNLSGERVGVLPYERMDEEVLEDTPEMIHNIPQPHFEEFLAERLSHDPKVSIRKGISFVSCKQISDECVITTVEERATQRYYQIASRHVVACDGARSKVRESLAIECEGEDSYETMMTIHFNANLRPVVGKRIGMLHWVMDPVVSGFIIGYDLTDNQVLISNFDSDKHPVDSWNEDLCREIVTAAIGQEIPFDVLSYRPWILSRKIAKQYHQGGIFLAGDAAHSFPPTGGLGLNSGLADVHALAYRLALVHKGVATSKCLNSYESDRRPVAEVNSRQSVKNGHKIFSLLKSLGIAGAADVQEARRHMFETLKDQERRTVIDQEIEAQREHFDNLELHIGYVYGSSKIPLHASQYTPKYIVGARLPHVWVDPTSALRERLSLPQPVDVSYVHELCHEEVQLRKYSSLDLCAYDAFTLIGGHGHWSTIVKGLESARVWPVNMYTLPKVNMVQLDEDFTLLSGTNAEAWAQGCGLGIGEALLVRPDQHILARLRPDATLEQLATVLKQHLGWI